MVQTRKNKSYSKSKNKNNNNNQKQNKNKSRKRKTNTKTRVFKKSDFYSGDGMVTKIWGPAFWHTLHTISFNYPVNPTEEDKKHYRDYILSLQFILPCKYCRQNLKTNFKNLPLNMCHMKNRDSFSRYIYELHELINKMLKKKSGLTYCDVRERYEHFRSRCTQNDAPKIFKFNNTRKNNKENGCTEPLYGEKAKCVIQIVPQEEKTPSFVVDNKCIKIKVRDE